MSARKGLAIASQAGAAGAFSLAPRRKLPLRLSNTILLDVLGAMDVCLVVIAAVLAKFLYIKLFLVSDQDMQPYVVAGLAGGIIQYYVFRINDLHGRAAILDWRSRWWSMLFSIGLAFLVLIALAYLLKLSADYSRGWLLTWLALTMVLVPCGRFVSARVLRWLTFTGAAVRRIAIVGDGVSGQLLAQRLSGVSGVTIADAFEVGQAKGHSEEATITAIIAAGERNEFDEIVIASARLGARAGQLVDQLSVLPVSVWLHVTDLSLPIRGTEQLGKVNLLEVKSKPLGDWEAVCKLLIDYVFGAICLILFAPLMLAIVLAIRLDSKGPAIFRQRRHGYNHRVIDVYKFRTMTVAENGEHVEQARKDDTRVTRIGKFLRRTSLDELPQLLNVLKGEMSLVGPRPHAVAHNIYYRQHLASYARRHIVKPGMTGLAQVNGLRGSTEDPEKMNRRVQMDLYYIENWSLWLDIKILWLTPFRGFLHSNAY